MMNRVRPIASLAAAAALALALLAGASPAGALSVPGSTYFPLTPTRLLDTRVGTGAPVGPLGPGASLDLTVVGVAGVPVTGVTAVVLNVVATDATAPDSYLAVYPAGTARPLASNLNVQAGKTGTNLVTITVPTTGDKAGKVSIYNNLGTVSVVADISGWYSANGGPVGATYYPLVPARVLDSRIGVGALRSDILAGQTIDVQVTGVGGVPATGVSAVVLNVTAVHVAGPESFLTVFPSGTTRPLASNLNFLNRRAVPNLVIARIGTNGMVSMYNNLGVMNVVADVQGWYTSTGVTSGATYVPLMPARDLDTRVGTGTGGAVGKMGAGQILSFAAAGVNGVPAAGVAAVILNVTAVDHVGADSFLTVFPTPAFVDGWHPLASTLNVVHAQTVPNLVVVPVGPSGRVSVYNDAGAVDVVADVQGWFLFSGA